MEATGRSMAQLKKELEVTGDMGSVAAASRGSQRTMMAPKRLTVQSASVSLNDYTCPSIARGAHPRPAAMSSAQLSLGGWTSLNTAVEAHATPLSPSL